MCWDSDLNWSGLEDQHDALEKGVQRPESDHPIRCQELWPDWGRNVTYIIESGSSDIALASGAFISGNPLWSKTRSSNNSNTESNRK